MHAMKSWPAGHVTAVFAITVLALAACNGHTGGSPLQNGSSSAQAGPSASEGKPVIAWAPPPTDATDADMKAAGNAVGVFIEPCLSKFPDDGSVEALAKAKGLTPMT